MILIKSENIKTVAEIIFCNGFLIAKYAIETVNGKFFYEKITD